MKPLPAHFIIRPEHMPSLDKLLSESVDSNWPLFNTGPECWGLLTYILLRQAGYEVTAGVEARDGVVNVVFATLAKAFHIPCRAWTLIVRADYRALWLADEHVVQNKLQVAPSSTWVPLWPQAGLIPRHSHRQGCERVAFFGLPYYLAGGVDEWNRRLTDLGMTFEIRNPTRWNDYSDVDAVIAIRTFDEYAYPRKPPSKLVNAWLAGVPAICGADSAYQQIAEPRTEYLRATTMDSAIEHLKRLKSDNRLYEQLIQIGHERSREFTRERTVNRWREIIESAEARRQAQCRGTTRLLRWALKNSAHSLYISSSNLKRRLFGRSKLSR